MSGEAITRKENAVTRMSGGVFCNNSMEPGEFRQTATACPRTILKDRMVGIERSTLMRKYSVIAKDDVVVGDSRNNYSFCYTEEELLVNNVTNG